MPQSNLTNRIACFILEFSVQNLYVEEDFDVVSNTFQISSLNTKALRTISIFRAGDYSDLFMSGCECDLLFGDQQVVSLQSVLSTAYNSL